jgi:hypothetical protein
MLKFKVKGLKETMASVREQVQQAHLKAIHEDMGEMLDELIEKTPVDTGYAKSRWRLVSTWNPLFPVKIVNDCPYMPELNSGHSNQAPAYFIERTALKYGKPVGSIVVVKNDPGA